MTGTVKKWDQVTRWGDHLQIKSTMMALSDTGKYVLTDDYARLEQECENHKKRIAIFSSQLEAMQLLRDHYKARADSTEIAKEAALKQVEGLQGLLAQCQEHLDPHRDAVLWGAVCDALQAKPCAPTK